MKGNNVFGYNIDIKAISNNLEQKVVKICKNRPFPFDHMLQITLVWCFFYSR